MDELKNAFIEAVKDYKNICKDQKKEIYKSFKGNFNIRISS